MDLAARLSPTVYLSSGTVVRGIAASEAPMRDFVNDRSSFGDGQTFELGDLVNDQLSFIRLRLDLIRLCHRFGVPYTFLTTVEAWRQFAVGLIRVLADKPIALPAAPDKAKQARADIDAIRAAMGFAPIQIAIGHPMPDGEPYWIMPVDGGKTMITRLFIGIYKPEDFPFPAGWTP
jgi:hypothetical protein